eukprot:1943760-Prymnesium_polylepis.2
MGWLDGQHKRLRPSAQFELGHFRSCSASPHPVVRYLFLALASQMGQRAMRIPLPQEHSAVIVVAERPCGQESGLPDGKGLAFEVRLTDAILPNRNRRPHGRAATVRGGGMRAYRRQDTLLVLHPLAEGVDGPLVDAVPRAAVPGDDQPIRLRDVLVAHFVGVWYVGHPALDHVEEAVRHVHDRAPLAAYVRQHFAVRAGRPSSETQWWPSTRQSSSVNEAFARTRASWSHWGEVAAVWTAGCAIQCSMVLWSRSRIARCVARKTPGLMCGTERSFSCSKQQELLKPFIHRPTTSVATYVYGEVLTQISPGSCLCRRRSGILNGSD